MSAAKTILVLEQWVDGRKGENGEEVIGEHVEVLFDVRPAWVLLHGDGRLMFIDGRLTLFPDEIGAFLAATKIKVKRGYEGARVAMVRAELVVVPCPSLQEKQEKSDDVG